MLWKCYLPISWSANTVSTEGYFPPISCSYAIHFTNPPPTHETSLSERTYPKWVPHLGQDFERLSCLAPSLVEKIYHRFGSLEDYISQNHVDQS